VQRQVEGLGEVKPKPVWTDFFFFFAADIDILLIYERLRHTRYVSDEMPLILAAMRDCTLRYIYIYHYCLHATIICFFSRRRHAAARAMLPRDAAVKALRVLLPRVTRVTFRFD